MHHINTTVTVVFIYPLMMTLAVLFILGAIFGSFFNVVIDRLANEQDFIFTPSHCDYCQKKLAQFDLIPIISYVTLKGRCRYCHHKLSFYYLLVEFASGLLFVFTYLFVKSQTHIFSWTDFSYYLLIYSGLVIIFFSDIKYHLIPDEILLVSGLATFFYLIYIGQNNLYLHIFSALVLFFIFVMIIVITKGKGMGFGDAKYALFMGLFLGYPMSLVAVYLAFILGATYSVILLILKIKNFKSAIPFGPFLVIATVFVQLNSKAIIKLLTDYLP